jgi:hypothetical protein
MDETHPVKQHSGHSQQVEIMEKNPELKRKIGDRCQIIGLGVNNRHWNMQGRMFQCRVTFKMEG